MVTTEVMQGTGDMDAELVARSLEGNRDAFRQIVERHQSLLCALAYSALGNLFALLTNKNIPYETLLQGRDFGYGEPTRPAAFCWAIGQTLAGTSRPRPDFECI